jgi:hypothetical protein
MTRILLDLDQYLDAAQRATERRPAILVRRDAPPDEVRWPSVQRQLEVAREDVQKAGYDPGAALVVDLAELDAWLAAGLPRLARVLFVYTDDIFGDGPEEVLRTWDALMAVGLCVKFAVEDGPVAPGTTKAADWRERLARNAESALKDRAREKRMRDDPSKGPAAILLRRPPASEGEGWRVQIQEAFCRGQAEKDGYDREGLPVVDGADLDAWLDLPADERSVTAMPWGDAAVLYVHEVGEIAPRGEQALMRWDALIAAGLRVILTASGIVDSGVPGSPEAEAAREEVREWVERERWWEEYKKQKP